MWHSAALRFASDHPTAAGHFPANPIIPGALLLDEVVAAIAQEAGIASIVVRAAKFLQPVRPGETVALRWEARADGAVRFECQRAGELGLAMTGMLEIRQDPG